MRIVLLLSFAVLAGCGAAPQPAPSEPAPSGPVPSEPAPQVGPQPIVTSCGDISRTNDDRCPAGAEDKARCFVDAVNSCRIGTVLDEAGQTIEGGTVRYHYEVVAAGSGCSIVRTIDWREDRFSGGGFTRATCTGASIGDGGECQVLSTTGCGEDAPIENPS